MSLALVLTALMPAWGQAGPTGVPGLPSEDLQRSAERMYLEGVLPSGKAMQVTRLETPPAPGTAFACAGCHLRAGLGQREAGVLTPPINAAKLFKPSHLFYPDLSAEERKDLPGAIRDPLRRPAYTDASLTAAVREGVDPTGRKLSEIMPRYLLDDREAALLVGYLESLSREFSPGADDDTLHFATVVTDGISREDRSAFLTTLEHQVRIHNNLWANYRGASYRTLAMLENALAFRKWSLAVWELQGPQDNWLAQLEEHDREGPVFALLGGISYGDWRPVHEFAEAHGLPCILPITDFPVTSGSGSHTLYFSGGFHQEGVATAAHLAVSPGSKPVLMVRQDTEEGRALCAGFREGWAQRGRPPVREIAAPPAGEIDRSFLARLLRRQPNATLVLWAGPEVYKALSACVAGPDRPSRVIMSASYLGEEVWNLPQNAREQLLLTYPYRLQKPVATMAGPAIKQNVSLVTVDNDRRTRSRAFTLMQVLGEGIQRMGRDFYREHFLDGFGLMEDKTDSDYPLLSFNPGQRLLATGCYLVRLPRGPLHGFVRETDWAIPTM